METIHRFSLRLLALKSIPGIPLRRSQLPLHVRFIPVHTNRFIKHYNSSHSLSSLIPKAGWLLGLGEKKNPNTLPKIVKAGDPVLHEPAKDVEVDEIGSDRIQKFIDDMIKVMRLAPGVGLAAPQIGIPLKIIVLEDTREYISYAPKDETKAQDRRPFDLLFL